jgi:carbonic anhydrase
MEHRSVEQSLANLRTFPFVRAREASGTISVHGAWFDVATGDMEALGAGGWTRVEAG